MRPRPDAAENFRFRAPSTEASAGFNEAAARCRGKPKPVRGVSAEIGVASMRPRPDAAENALPATHCDSRCSPPRRERSRDPDRQAEPDAYRLTTGAL